MNDADYAPIGLVLFHFAVFCAYWAQETGRSALLWFFLGAVAPPLAGIALLLKNRRRRRA